jgi:NADH-quinone oxidoreductase subunit G/NADP-reducing hydrogenase subunit HndD
MLELTINNKKVSAPEGSTILQAAKLAGIKIPTLCNLPGIHTNGSCRMCVVEVEGQKKLMASCIVKAQNGMVVRTNTDRVQKARKIIYDLIIANHPQDCTYCQRNQNCELQELGYTLGITSARIPNKSTPEQLDVTPSITRDPSKCVLCRR